MMIEENEVIYSKIDMKFIDTIRLNGIVGAGGAGFPTYVKLNKNIDTVIVNGAECEPLLLNDKYLLKFFSEKIIKGLQYIINATNAKKGYIVFKKKYSVEMQDLINLAQKIDGIEIVMINDFYPAGDETILVYEVTGRLIPEGGLPLDVGCVVNNVETVLNIYEAIVNNKPVTKRYITCTGEVKNPSIVHAHIGTTIGEIIDNCGGALVDEFSVVIGGPMMGYIENDLSTPVTKITNSIIVLPNGHKLITEKTKPIEYMVKMSKSVCTQCTECTNLCPRYLIGYDLKPHLIMRQINYGLYFPQLIIENAFLCSECGLCEYACAMGLSPRIVIKEIKKELKVQGFSPSFQNVNRPVRDIREYRKVPTSRLINRLHLAKYADYVTNNLIQTNPDRVEIMLKQHIGEPSYAIVQVGDMVKEGSLIAKIPDGAIGSNIHASISGKVLIADKDRIIIER